MLESNPSPAASADILVVDDTPENLKVLVGVLSTHGHRVRPVSSGVMALQAARAQTPDLIFLDVQMPGMDGYAVCRALKEDAVLAAVPVIFLSAFTDPAHKVQAFAAGGVDFVSKPFAVEEVLARAAIHLKLLRDDRALRESYATLKALEEHRDSLVHMLVHDLRTPLTGICLFLETLHPGEGQPQPMVSLRCLGEALKASERMIRMVNAVLDVNKFEAGQMQLRWSDCDLEAIVRDAAASLEIQGANRIAVLPSTREGPVRADREMLFRVLQNLLGNALKYAPGRGDIKVEIQGGDHVAEVRVTDQGPGVPEAFREQIFQKFGRAPEVTRRGLFSTGLGLPFCKLAIEAHGGAIGVDSGPGRGSCFWFRLPQGTRP